MTKLGGLNREMFACTVLEARSLKSRRPQGCLGDRPGLLHLLGVQAPQLVAASLILRLSSQGLLRRALNLGPT